MKKWYMTLFIAHTVIGSSIQACQDDDYWSAEDLQKHHIKAEDLQKYQIEKTTRLVCPISACIHNFETKKGLAGHVTRRHRKRVQWNGRLAWACPFPDCAVKASRPYIIKQHICSSKHLNYQRHKCGSCDKIFSDSAAKIRHEQRHHSTMVKSCPYDECLFTYRVTNDLTKHIERKHSKY